MGNYEQLKQSVSEVIRTNGNQEITGSILQSALLTIISTVGANATFAGIATPTTNPGTPDGPVFYIASENGTYSNFGNVELQYGLSVLTWNGSSWSSQHIFSIDDEPTAGSDNLVKSGGVQEELALGAVYDVSAKNPTAGSNNDGKFESLSALLADANLNTLIPTPVRKGGMSIKFVQSSDNKYVCFNYLLEDAATSSNFTNIENWEKIEFVGLEETVKVVEVPIEWTSGKFITQSGDEYPLENWNITDFIPITKNANPILTAYFDDNNMANIVSFYNEFKIFISGYTSASNFGYHKAMPLEVPTDAKYVRFSISNDVLSTHEFSFYSLCHGEEKTIQGVSASVNTLKIPLTWIDGKYITTTGDEANNAAWIVTDFIPTNEFANATIRAYLDNNDIYNIVSFYDVHKTYISGFTPSTNTGYHESLALTIPAGARYIRLSISKDFYEEYGFDLYSLVHGFDKIDVDITPEFSQLGYIDNNGDEATNAEWKRTNFIETSNKDLYVTTDYITGDINIVSYYNANKVYIGGIAAPAKLTNQKLTLPINTKYIRYCSNVSLVDKFCVKSDLDAVYRDIKTDIMTNMVGVITPYYFITENGRPYFLNANNFGVTGFLYVAGLQSIHIDVVSDTGVPLIYAFYDKNKDFISGLAAIDENFDKVIDYHGYLVSDVDVPSSAHYMRLTLNPNYKQFVGTSNENYWKILEQVKRITDNNIMLPKYIDVAVGHQCNIFFDSLRRINRQNEHIELNYQDEAGFTLFEDHLQIEQSQVLSNKNIQFAILDDDLKFIAKKTTTIRVSPTSGGNGSSKNICIMGDSLIDGTYTPKQAEEFLLADNDYDFHFLGTRGTAPYLHEGRGGWSWENYLTASYGGITNAFWNTSLDRLDFKNYMSTYFPTLDDKIDIFIACLGTNDVEQGMDTNINYAAIIARAKTFIDQLLTDYPNCKVVIGLCGYGAPNMQGSIYFQNKIQILDQLYVDNFDNGAYNANVTTVAHGLWIDRWNSYQYSDIARTDKESTLNRVFTNLAHPTIVGYKQWGDALYAKIRAILNGLL